MTDFVWRVTPFHQQIFNHWGLYLGHFGFLIIFLKEILNETLKRFFGELETNLSQKCIEIGLSDKPIVIVIFLPSLLQTYTFKVQTLADMIHQ